MKEYIATFYSHYGAIRYKKMCEQAGLKSKIMPVPRTLSSSCGTCVKYADEILLPNDKSREEIEQIVMITEEGYKMIYSSEEDI